MVWGQYLIYINLKFFLKESLFKNPLHLYSTD